MRIKIKITATVLAVIGFFIIYGTAGASDLNIIGFSHILWLLALGLLLFVSGLLLGKVAEKYDERA